MDRSSQKDVLMLTNENIMNAYLHEPTLWNSELKSTKESKDLAWRRLVNLFGMKNEGKLQITVTTI